MTDRPTTINARPIFEGLTGAFKQADVAKDIRIDETMLTCFGKKQFIREKTIRLSKDSYNLWALGYSCIT